MNCVSKKAWLIGLFIGLGLLLFPLASYSENYQQTTSPPYQGAKIWASPETITTNIERYGSTAVDSNNQPAIVYQSRGAAQSDLSFAKWTGAEWEIELAEAQILAGSFKGASLAIDSLDNPHISYAECLFECDPRYATKTDGSWTYMDNLNGYGALDLDTNDTVHIGYHHEPTSNIKHMVMPDDTWVLSTVITDTVSNQHISMKVDQDDSPRMTYYKNNNRLYHARTSGPFWFEQIIAYTPASDPLDGQYTSLAIDSNNYSHIAYYDGQYKNLKYSYAAEDGWHSSLVDMSADVGLYVAMVLDSDDRPHIVYYDATNTAIKYARQTEDGWITTTVDDNVPNGDTIGLAIDSEGRLHLSYHYYEAFLESALKYTWSDLTTFQYDIYLPLITK